jgi:hypothetical protein
VVLGAILLYPSPSEIPHLPQTAPTFFSSGASRDVLRPDEVVFAIPDLKGQELLWQDAADFSFRLAQGYVGPIPMRYADESLNKGLQTSRLRAGLIPGPMFADWLNERQVSAIVLPTSSTDQLAPFLRSVGGELAYEGGGVSVWRSPSGAWVDAGEPPG